jgi:hypothetical protein
MKLAYSIAIEDPLGPVGWEVFPRTAGNGLSNSARLEILEVSRTACL